MTSLYDCGGGGAYFAVGATAPGAPSADTVWINPTTGLIQRYDGSAWVNLMGDYADDAAAAAAGVALGGLYHTAGAVKVRIV